jgi:hypothetical protein
MHFTCHGSIQIEPHLLFLKRNTNTSKPCRCLVVDDTDVVLDNIHLRSPGFNPASNSRNLFGVLLEPDANNIGWIRIIALI